MVFSTTSGALSTSFQNWSFYFRRRPCTELEDASRSPSSVSHIRILHIHINNNTSCSHGTSTLSFITIHIGYITSNFTLPVARPAHITFLTFNYTRIIPSLAPDIGVCLCFWSKNPQVPELSAGKAWLDRLALALEGSRGGCYRAVVTIVTADAGGCWENGCGLGRVAITDLFLFTAFLSAAFSAFSNHFSSSLLSASSSVVHSATTLHLYSERSAILISF